MHIKKNPYKFSRRTVNNDRDYYAGLYGAGKITEKEYQEVCRFLRHVTNVCVKPLEHQKKMERAAKKKKLKNG